MTIYIVRQPVGSSDELLLCGPIISRHRTPKAAYQAIDRAVRSLRRQAGQSQSYLDWHVQAIERGGTARCLEPHEIESANDY